MKNFKGWKTGLLFAALILMAALPAASSKTMGKSGKLVVIVKSDGALSSLNSKDIPAIYLGDKQFENGDKVEPLVNGDKALSGLFLKKVLEKTEAQYKKIWSGKAFIDGLSAPTVLPTSGDIVREVEKNADAIGFVAEKDVPDSKDLKVIYSVDASEK